MRARVKYCYDIFTNILLYRARDLPKYAADAETLTLFQPEIGALYHEYP